MSLGKTCAELFVTAANVAFFILGALVAGFGIKVATVVNNDFDDLETKRYVVPTIIFGFALMIFSIIGFIGVFSEKRCFLMIYSIGVFVVAIAIIAIGAALLEYNNDLDNSKDGNAGNSRQALILDFTYASFLQCCDPPVGIPVCGQIITSFCQNDANRVASFEEGIQQSGLCDVLADTEIDGHALVSDNNVDILNGACGTFLIPRYLDDFVTVVGNNMSKIAVANIVVGVLILLLLSASCYLVSSDKKTSNKYKK